MGSLGDNYAGNTINQLKDAVYTVALGVPPQWIGWALSLPRLLDAFFDPLVGFWSDHHFTRWGRRRPFILAGAIGLGLTIAAIWFPPSGMSTRALTGFFFVTTALFYAAYSVFLVPYRALGLELTHDYHERTRLQAWGMMIGLAGGFGLPWLYKLTLLAGGIGHDSPASPGAILAGARWVGAGVAGLILVSCLVPALACRESAASLSSKKISLKSAVSVAFRNRPFLQMLSMNFFAVLALFVPVGISLLVSIYLLFQGDQSAAATLIGWLGSSQMLGSFIGVPVNTALSVKIGKRNAALFSLGIAALGYASLWITLLPAHPYWALSSHFFIGWGLQGVWLMSASMNADVCDRDELVTGARHEGMYGAVYGLEQKLSYSVAALLGGVLVERCGYLAGLAPTLITQQQLRVVLVAAPVIALALAAICIARYPLTQACVVETQQMLAARRSALATTK